MDNVFVSFLQNQGLYDRIEITRDNILELCYLLSGRVKFDVYCPECKQNRVFDVESIPYFDGMKQTTLGEFLWTILENQNKANRPVENAILSNIPDSHKNEWHWKPMFFYPDLRCTTLVCHCSMNKMHDIFFTILFEGDYLYKIGQYPSVADLTFPELDVYKRVIQKEDRREMGTALGLFANGIGAGSYVYLRRIFERLLYQAADLVEGLDKTKFARTKVDEKIKMVKNILPPMLTENPVLYGILSKGIHELSEQDCLAYFPVLKDCIFMILEQWEEQRCKEERQASLTSALNKIAAKI